MREVLRAARIIVVVIISFFSLCSFPAQAQVSEPVALDRPQEGLPLGNTSGPQEAAPAAIEPLSETVVPPALCVNGIIYDPQNPTVIVNGVTARISDMVGGARIQSISDSQVTFQYQDLLFVRSIGEGCAAATTVAQPRPKPKPSASSTVRRSSKAPSFTFRVKRTGGNLSQSQIERQVEAIVAGMGIMLFVIIGALYIYMAVILQILAQKTGTEGGWLAWVPIANLFLQCSIAGKSYLWILMLFVPFVGPVIFFISIWMGIAQARGKPGWLGILMLLPVVSLIVPGYLAFCKDAPVAPVEAKEPPPDPLAHIGKMK